jgi:asparagine synthase (glutamine-hydrolysing)
VCGIAGVVGLGPEAPPLREEEARGMAARLAHRGPDGRGTWRAPSGRAVLGHARLRVIDLETGDQPMPNEDGSVQAVFNGEIYNFRELRAELETRGHRFRSRSDTEVLVHGYEAWGDGLPERLDGMFAFGIWDERRRRLLLARDRTGQKPLFWTRAGGRMAFASEPKALRTLPWVPDAVDPDALPRYLAYGYVPAPDTLHRGIRVLPPASRMTVEAPEGRVAEPERYWRVRWSSPGRRALPRERAVDAVRRLLEEAVERRLVADVPVGAFLSGGIDSSLVVGLMRRHVQGPLRTFSLGFADDPSYDETAWARRVSGRFETEHTEFRVQADEIELVDRLVEAHDHPFGDSSAIPTWIVSRLTREHVTVALTGDGGDEMFAGYPRFLGMVLAEGMPRWMAVAGAGAGRLLPRHRDFRHPTRRARRFFRAAALPAEERMLRWIGFLPARLDDLLRPEHRDRLDRADLTASFRAPWDEAEGASTLARTLALNFHTYLPEDLLVKVDRCSMAHGLELRSPFLDTALVEFAAGLPDAWRIRGGTLKWLLREAFPDLLPGAVRRRGKMGFGVPLPLWFRTHWREVFRERLFDPGARTWDWLRREAVETLWVEHQSGTHDHGHALWALLTLETWLRARGS